MDTETDISICTPLYKTLESTSHIRLISILPAIVDPITGTAPIQCVLFSVDINSVEGKYVAISYAWGSRETPNTILCNGQIVSVSDNLISALIRLRRAAEYGLPWSRIWVDALCINQATDVDSLRERGHQVQMMNRIFGQAREVIINLGDEVDSDSLAMNLITRLAKAKLEQYYRPITDSELENADLPKSDDVSWRALSKFLSRPWFRRVWVIQELALARIATVLIGLQYRSFSSVEKAVSTLDRISNQTLNFPAGASGLRGLRALSKMLTLQMSRMDPNIAAYHLANLFLNSRGFESTDHRDQIYALVGMIRGPQQAFKVDYEETLDSLRCRFIQYMISTGLGGHIWGFMSGISSECPSWAADLRSDGDELAAGPGGVYRAFGLRFQASKATVPNITVMQSVDGQWDTLQASGRIITSVATLSIPLPVNWSDKEPPDPGDATTAGKKYMYFRHYWVDLALKFAATNPIHDPVPPNDDELWKTLVFDHDQASNQRAGPELQESAMAFLKLQQLDLLPPGLGLATDNDDFPEDIKELHLQSTRFIRGMLNAMRDRRLCFTDRGFLGNVPTETETIDKIAVICGASVPVVLRPQDDGKYRFVGLCYIHGIMDGEALDFKDWIVEDILVK